MIHNLNFATTSLQNAKNFPSRFDINESGIKIIQSILKRISRIFAHSHLYHNEIFMEYEVGVRNYRKKAILGGDSLRS